MLRCFLGVNILLEAHLCDFHQGYGYGSVDEYSEAETGALSKRFTFTFTRVLGRLNCALALAEFLVVFSSFLCPSTFYLLLYLFYNSIRVLLCFSILYSLFAYIRLFFVCIC